MSCERNGDVAFARVGSDNGVEQRAGELPLSRRPVLVVSIDDILGELQPHLVLGAFLVELTKLQPTRGLLYVWRGLRI